MERVAYFQSVLLHVSGVHHKTSPDKKKFYLSLEGRRKGTSPPSPKQVPYGIKMPISRSLLSISFGVPSQGALTTKCGENNQSPSVEPHTGGRPTYSGVRPGSPRGSLMTLLSLRQCHAAFNMIPSTLAWVD